MPTSPLRAFMERHYLHFNSREVVRAARAWEAHIQAGGKMLVSLAGAMSTARIGQSLAELIRRGHVHAISCTGANLEEDAFVLLAGHEYELIDDWRALTVHDEQGLLERGMNRVTDTCIPETVMRHVERRLLEGWNAASAAGVRRSPAEHLVEALQQAGEAGHYQLDPRDSWLLAAHEAGIPVFTPGFEDSTTGNMFAAAVYRGAVPNHDCVLSGTAQMERLMRWYLANCGLPEEGASGVSGPSVGFFQIGGGIAGDFAICTVPALVQDLQMHDLPLWGYFCQVSDSTTSYGGYSGAVPNEKITWGKLGTDTPKFMVESDATIVAPLIFGWLLGW